MGGKQAHGGADVQDPEAPEEDEEPSMAWPEPTMDSPDQSQNRRTQETQFEV